MAKKKTTAAVKKPAPVPAPTPTPAPVLTLVSEGKFLLPVGFTTLQILVVSMASPLPFPQAYPNSSVDPVTRIVSFTDPNAAEVKLQIPASGTRPASPVLTVPLVKAVDKPTIELGPTEIWQEPGDSLAFGGEFSAAAKVYGRKSGTTTAILFPCVQTSRVARQMHVEMPLALTTDRYLMWVQDGANKSAEIAINQARGIQHDWPDAVPGSWMWLYGRCLALKGFTPQVFAQPIGGGARLTCTVDLVMSQHEQLRYQLPATAIPGTTYNIYLRNGLGGTEGETLAEQPLRCLAPLPAGKAPGIDPRVAAAHPHLVREIDASNNPLAPAVPSDGTDATPALNTLIYQVAISGGGFIDGGGKNYYVDMARTFDGGRDVFCGNFYDDRVALRNFNFTYAKEEHLNDYGACLFMAKSQIGIQNVSFKNLNLKGGWEANLIVGSDGGQSNIFLINVTGDIVGQPVTCKHVDRLYVENPRITSRYAPNVFPGGPLTFLSCTNVLLKKTANGDARLLHEIGYSAFQTGKNIVVDGITVIRDAAINNSNPAAYKDTRNLSSNFAENFVYINTANETINGPAIDEDAGETNLNEGGGPNEKRPDQEYGNVTSANATTLSDSRGVFGVRGPVTAKAIVAITNGKGMFQWRRVLSATATTLTIDRPWNTIPDTTSVYTLTNWSALNWTVANNTSRNNRAGWVIYQASALNCVWRNTSLVNNHAIAFQPYQQEITDQAEPMKNGRLLTPQWNMNVVDCTVTDTGNIHPYVPAYIGVYARYFQCKPLGPLTGNITIRRCKVTALPSYVKQTGDGSHYPYYDKRQENGFYAAVENQFDFPGTPFNFGNNNRVPEAFGVLFDQCETVNCAHSYIFDNGTMAATIVKPKGTNNGALISDTRQLDAQFASQGTSVVLPQPS
jgi:hypothetical protein